MSFILELGTGKRPSSTIKKQLIERAHKFMSYIRKTTKAGYHSSAILIFLKIKIQVFTLAYPLL